MPASFIPPNHLAQNEETKLINVSDDEDSDEEDEDNDSSSHDEDSDESESDEDSILDIDESGDVKVLKLNINSSLNDDEEIGLLETEEFDDHLSDVESVSSKSSSLSLKQLPLEENKDDLAESELKTININLEEHTDSLDYKKLPLPKLRSIVSEKGLSTDSNKLKKNELLKLLGVE